MKYIGWLLLFGATLLRLPFCAGRASWPQNRWIYPKCRALRISGRGFPIPCAFLIFVEAPEIHRNHRQTCPWPWRTGRSFCGFPALLILPLHQPSFWAGPKHRRFLCRWPWIFWLLHMRRWSLPASPVSDCPSNLKKLKFSQKPLFEVAFKMKGYNWCRFLKKR